MRIEYATAVVLALLLVLSPAFLAGTGTGGEPANFDDLVTVGLTQVAVSEVGAAGGTIPKAQVRYARFQYGVGYYGIESLVARLREPGHRQRYGRALTVHVSDFTDTGVELTDAGYLTTDTGTAPDWVRAEAAYFVVGSRARTPEGPTVVPFSERAAAARFADRFGGRVVGWASVASAWADRTVAATAPLLDRPVGATVEPGASVAAAVERAPPNTTVRLRPGVHRVRNLTVDRPVTIRGSGPETVLLGDGNGTVLEFHADRSAVTDLRVAGVGDSTSGNLSRAGNWEETIRLAYAVADAGVRFVGANDSLVADVGVRTPANGVVFVDSDGGVVRDSRIVGETPSRAGFMSALAFRSRIVVQESQFHGGRDAVYTHRSHGLVVRDNRIRTVRFGVHEMYTSRSLVRNNTVRDADIGLVVMTRPTGNALVDNTVAGGVTGLSTAGSRSYVADNVVFDTKYGVHTATTDTRYTGNLLAGNRYGLRAGSLLPSDRVSGNDFVDNRRHIKARSLGSLQVWTVAERGNYWTGAPGLDRDGDGTLDRSFRPTGPVDGLAYRVDGGPALARAPAVALLRGTRTAVPGFQRAGVLDTAPLAAPAGSDPTARLRRGRERTRQIVENPDRLVVPVPNGTLNASRTGAVERVGRSRPTEVTTP